jgi:diguanylate cyclase (GGDEF)-like protein
VSSDQITYVLVALVVTGVAVLLLLVGALVARRGRSNAEQAAYATAPGAAAQPAAPAYIAAPLEPAPLRAHAPLPAPEPEPAPEPQPAPEPEIVVAAAPAAQPLPEATVQYPDAEHGPEEAAVTPEDLEAAARRVHDPREQDVIDGFLSISPRRRETAAFEASPGPTASAPVPSTVAVATLPGTNPPDPYVDDVTGLDSREAWDRTLAEENARYVRYRRPVGLVVAELDGLARFEREFGPEASRRILVAVGAAMRRGARRTDRVAHVGNGRFLAMLPETDEIQAINYVERVRGECERWLAAGAVALHVAVGWASPSAVGELDTALRTAEERMYAERRRAARAGSFDADASR